MLRADAMWLAPVLRRVGEIKEAKGDRAGAVQSYERFVSLWRDADPALRILRHHQLALLQSGT